MEALHAAQADAVLSWLAYAGAPRPEAEDLAQEVWRRVCEAFRKGQYREEGKVEAWLFTIVRNVWLSRRTPRFLQATAAPPAPATPPQEAEARELEARWRRAIASLPEPQREVYLMRAFGSLPFRDIAEALGRPLGTVLPQMQDALRRLRAELYEEAAR